jgi:hypothetical protein
MWVSTLTILQLAEVCGVRLSQARRWVRAAVIKPIRREGQAYVYGRDDAVVGAVLKLLQQTLGEKSPLPLSLAADLRPRLVGWLRWNQKPSHGGAIKIPVTRGDMTVTVEVGASELDAICERLDALPVPEKRGSRSS